MEKSINQHYMSNFAGSIEWHWYFKQYFIKPENLKTVRDNLHIFLNNDADMFEKWWLGLVYAINTLNVIKMWRIEIKVRVQCMLF